MNSINDILQLKSVTMIYDGKDQYHATCNYIRTLLQKEFLELLVNNDSTFALYLANRHIPIVLHVNSQITGPQRNFLEDLVRNNKVYCETKYGDINLRFDTNVILLWDINLQPITDNLQRDILSYTHQMVTPIISINEAKSLWDNIVHCLHNCSNCNEIDMQYMQLLHRINDDIHTLLEEKGIIE